jgi:hypothetical protein
MNYLLRVWNKFIGREKKFSEAKHGDIIKTVRSLDVNDYIVAYSKDDRNSVHSAAHAAFGKGHIKTKFNKEVGGWICTRVK